MKKRIDTHMRGKMCRSNLSGKEGRDEQRGRGVKCTKWSKTPNDVGVEYKLTHVIIPLMRMRYNKLTPLHRCRWPSTRVQHNNYKDKSKCYRQDVFFTFSHTFSSIYCFQWDEGICDLLELLK